MPKTITPEQFRNATPGYVDRAHSLATAIFERALAGPDSAIQLQATVFNIDAPDYRELTSDLQRLAELWRTRKGLQGLEADAPVEGGRLALDDTLGIGRHLRVWAYTPPLTSGLARYKTPCDAPAEDDAEEGRSTGQRTDWIRSEARSHLANLTLPGYLFEASFGNIDDPADKPHILAYVYTPQDMNAGRRTFSSASGVGNIPENNFRQALAPPYTAADADLLEHYNVQTYHTAKIEWLLALMESVALA